MAHTEGTTLYIKDQQHDDTLQQPPSDPSQASVHTRQRWRIAELENKLMALESGHAVKDRQVNYYMAQGRAFRRVVALFDNIEDLVGENDRRYDVEDEETSVNQDRLQAGYVTLMNTFLWLFQTSSDMDYDDYIRMLKTLRYGADSARGDDTSKLKTLVSKWVNRELKPDPPVDMDDKHTRGFINDACGKLLCPTELDWNNPAVKAGIRDRAEGYIVTDLSFPAYLYEKYAANLDNLEDGLFKGKILIQSYKAVFTSPSSAKDVEGDGDGTDVIENNRRAKKAVSGIKVKKHVAQIIKMDKVTAHSIAYIACQTIVDFLKRPPGQDAQCRVNKLLEWWTRKVFGWSRCADLTDEVRAKMSVNTLARQRA
ncbi:hypothetical protein EDB19DRAFT_1908704 [Suillus lakei]|nr:hypothetical protein EDB19DRAFT_1908704 [Suillus lakei]